MVFRVPSTGSRRILFVVCLLQWVHSMSPDTARPWNWSHAKVVAVLGNNVARAMLAGRSSPVAERVLARLTSGAL